MDDPYSLTQPRESTRRPSWKLDRVLDGLGVLSLLAAVPSLFAAVVAGWLVHDATTVPASAALQVGTYVAFPLLPISVGVAIASATIAGIRGGRGRRLGGIAGTLVAFTLPTSIVAAIIRLILD